MRGWRGGHAWLRGACVAAGGVGGACVAAGGACMAAGGRAWLLGGHAWLPGGACVAAGGGVRGCQGGAWLLWGGGACMVGHVTCTPPPVNRITDRCKNITFAQTTFAGGNYNAKGSVEPEIFPTFQHKVERIPHFARVSEVRHMEEKQVIYCVHLCKMA